MQDGCQPPSQCAWKWLTNDGNYTGKYFISCSYLYMLNSRCRAMHFCVLNIFDLLCILPPQAAAQAKAKPKPAVFDCFGLACRSRKPEPSKARPKPWLSGQAGPDSSDLIKLCLVQSIILLYWTHGWAQGLNPDLLCLRRLDSNDHTSGNPKYKVHL